ncbi:metallophosphoesterase [Ruminococcus sp. AF41-9]|nr:metallophosphoesterase [Ruminococcus sp. AF41-9]
MVAIYLAPAYLAVCAYILFRTIHWIQVLHSIFQNVWVCRGIGLIYFFVVFSILIAFMAPASGFRRFMKLLSNYWLGVLVYTIMTVGIADGLRLLIKYPLKNVAFPGRELLFSNVGTAVVGAVCAVIITTVSIYGMINAGNIQTTKYDISIDKKAGKLDSLNVVLIADLHLGYNIGCRHMEKMVERINAQNPDLVVVAGDIFDNEYEALENPDRLAAILRGIQSKYGVYACYGNHDIQEKILAGFTFGGKEKKESSVKMDEFLEKSGITLLRDEYVLIDDSFYLYGRPDYERPGRGIDERKSPQEITEDLDLSLPVLVIDHEPRELQELADAGVDADLCGHTHDGQLFPGNLTIKLMWENACGYLKKGNMHSIVTSGVGLFGPNMRVGTKSEICDIMMHFNRIK